MKIYFIFLLLLSVSCEGMILNVDPSLEVLSKAFENVTRHLFQLETRMFINNYGIESDTMTSLVLKDLNENAMPFQLKNLQLEKEKIFLDSSTLLTFNNFAFFKEFNQKLKLTNEYFKPLQLFVYCQHATISDIESLEVDVTERAKSNKVIYENMYHLNSYLLDIIQYEYFLVDETDYIKLLTFVWFSPGKCGKLHLIELNKFNKVTRKWENDKFSMKKSANLHNCTIIAAEDPSPDAASFSQLDHEVSKSLQVLNNATMITGFFFKIDVLLAKGCLNSFDRYRNTQKDVGLRKEEDTNFITFPLEYIDIRLSVNDKFENYTEYDKLVMPFDEFTWAMIAITFVTAFATILILYCCVKKSIRDFIIGREIDTPWLNVIQIFFGISQVVMPRRNFARFLTMIFILYCLIIRTAWQGKTFEFMQKDIEKPIERTVDELIEKGYTFVMENNYEEKFPESEISKRGNVVAVDQDRNPSKDKSVEQINTCVIRYSFEFEEGIKQDFTWNQKYFLKRLVKQYSQLNICGLKLPRHHYLFETIDHRMKQHFVGDIFMHPKYGKACGNLPWPELTQKRFTVVEDTKVLNMKILEPGFVIWTVSLLFAVAAFIFEWIAIFKDYLVMKYIFRAFFQMQKCSQWPIKTSEKSTNKREMEMREENFERIRIQIEKKFYNREELIKN